ncbi:MAG TPA: FAD-dependent oxidoreductase [Ktedonobacteraceae bacterium]|jgi:choline dehydrogenase-like flavoprotein
MATVASHVPVAPEGADWLSAEEFALIEAICETLLPSLDPPPDSTPQVAAYYRRSARDLQVAEQLAAKLGEMRPEMQADIRLFLKLFTAPPVSLLLAGQARPFRALDQARRERFLLALANSPLPPFRQGYQGMKRLAGLIYFSALDEQQSNPNWPVLDYHPPEVHSESAPAPLKPFEISEDGELVAEVVVIGSGAGGGVVAGELARAGKDVIVLEQGGYNHAGNFSLREAQAMPELFLQRGALSSKDLGIIMMAGSTLGGGTVVNWMTSFRTPDDILAEWESQSGLRACFTSPELQRSFAEVEQRIQVNQDESQHNRQNQALYDGAQALGYHAGVVARNARGCQQRCGACNLGCRYTCSQSTLQTYLQDASERGARILVHARAERLLLSAGRATGVQASVLDARSGRRLTLTVRAKCVVLAAGALNTPALLLRSGLSNPHLGRHLHLHPTAISVGVYPEPVSAWEGVLQSAYSDQFTHLDGTYGYKLEVPPTHPGLFGLATPWYSARNYRDEMRLAAHLASIIVLARDRGEGRISVDSSGEPVVHYSVSAYDRQHLLHGLRQGTRIHLAAGARRVISLQNRPTTLRRSGQGPVRAEDVRAFDRAIARHGLGPNRIVLFSAHQMGTCRMGERAATSVVDGQQRVHGVQGLYVCDSSVFPGACGVNPMLSIMALAHRASQYIKEGVN